MVTGTAPLTALPGAPDPDSTSPAETRFRMSHCTPEKGEEFRTTRLKGSHTVLVFGCLT